MLPLCATGQSRVHYCCGSPQYKRELIVFSMIDTLGLNANLFNLWLELIALMEVNLVFSNHPETRKEVLHFYDYSSREYMLPILHTGDNIWQVLIEPVSLVRDRVLETLRLMASELKSDVSPNSTNPAYLTYIMDYIIFYCVCQEVFLFFWLAFDFYR